MPRTVPVSVVESPGNYLTGALWTAQVKAAMDFLMGSGSNGVPRFRGYQVTAQTCTTNVWTSLNIDTEAYDSDNGHSTSTNTSRYTVQVAGTYLVTASVGWTSATGGNRAVRIAVNGSAIPGSFVKTVPAVSGSTGLVTVAQVACVVGDYIEAQGNQNSGADLTTSNATDVACSLATQWISG